MILRGDARQLPLRDGCVQCCVTSPPYWGLRDYGCEGQIGLEPTPDAYVASLVQVFREVWRVLRNDGTVWLNLGDSYCTTTRGNRPGDFSTSSLTNPWRQDSVERGRVKDAESKQAINTGANFAGPNRLHRFDGLKHKDLVGIHWRVAFALQADGWYLRSDIIWHKPNPMPESVADRPTKAHEYLFLLAKQSTYYYDADAIREVTGSEMSAEEYARKTAPGATWPSGGITQYAGTFKKDGGQSHPNGRNKRSVWTIPTQPYPEAHFATFPEALIEPCILAGAPVGALVLDPFIGSGTTGVVCERLSRRWVGVDLTYQHLSSKRTEQRGLMFA